jgi:DHA1 family L-arabinose/isopropyl-beta-D-thiogalactopyranoside export protein-like MFS transporter
LKGKDWLPLIFLVVSVFVFNMSEFMPIGLLTDIAESFDISESKAGLIISVYAWAVAILSLPLMLLLRKMEYRRMLLMCVVIFAAFQFLTGLSQTYGMLMVSRLGVAVAHAVFWSIAAPMAVRIVEPRYAKVALSAVSAGTSIAMIVGLPLGRVIGIALGWRATFIVIGVISLLVLVALALVFPRLENPGTFTVKRLPGLLRDRVIAGIYVVIAVYVTGYYTMYSYIEPFLLDAGLSENGVTAMLTVLGLAGIGGSILFSKLYDRYRLTFLVSGMCFASLCMLALEPVSDSVLLLTLVVIIMGAATTAFTVAIQNELLRASPQDASAVAMSLFSGIFNAGIAMGSIIGGAVTDSLSVGDVGTVGFVFGICATAFAATYLVAKIKSSERAKTQQ